MEGREKFSGLLVRIMLVAFLSVWPHPKAVAEPEKEFSKSSIDLGIVVSDLDKAMQFYTRALGFKEAESFSIPKDIGEKTGLTDDKPITMKVLVLEEEENAAKLKLIKIPGAQSREGDNHFIHSQLGFRYITIFVNDMKKTLLRLEKMGVLPITKKLIALPQKIGPDVYLTVIRDPDQNLIELVGPKK